MRNWKYEIIGAVTICGIISFSGLALFHTCVPRPVSSTAISVEARDGYGPATSAAMRIWNGFVGCDIFTEAKEGAGKVTVMSDDGEPCGSIWRPKDEWDHAATAYRCREGKSEILVSRPGNINTQACIIAHELGHVLGIPHASRGVMGDACKVEQQNHMTVLDADVASLRALFCD